MMKLQSQHQEIHSLVAGGQKAIGAKNVADDIKKRQRSTS